MANDKVRPEVGPCLSKGLLFSFAVLSGLLTVLCYPRPGLCFLGWVSLSPLMWAWFRCRSPKEGFWLGMAAGTAFHGFLLHWIYDTALFAGIHPVIGALAWVALAVFLGLNWGLVGMLARWICGKGGLPRPWVWAATWTAVAALTTWTPRLGVDLMSYTQYKHLSLIQIGAFAGPHAMGFLVVAANGILAELWDGRTRSAPSVSLLMALLAGAWIYGEVELARSVWLQKDQPRAAVEILQPAIDQYRKWGPEFEREIVATFDELLSRPRKRRPDLVVWPESSLPWAVEEGEELPLASGWARLLKARQVVGVVTEDQAGDRRGSAVLLAPDGRAVGQYDKRELVPFGEYVPLGFLRRFIGYLSVMGDLTPGEPDQELWNLPLGRTAGSICYEALFPRWARFDAERGSRLIINTTNDGWYKDTWGPYQHFGSNIFRAIENRVFVVRCGNTGISAVIDPWGRVTARLDLNQKGRLDAEVPFADPFPRRSFYARTGDWFGGSCIGLMLVLALLRLAFARP